jgi:hypothetical protein
MKLISQMFLGSYMPINIGIVVIKKRKGEGNTSSK